jgi:hypothetical protein
VGFSANASFTSSDFLGCRAHSPRTASNRAGAGAAGSGLGWLRAKLRVTDAFAYTSASTANTDASKPPTIRFACSNASLFQRALIGKAAIDPGILMRLNTGTATSGQKRLKAARICSQSLWGSQNRSGRSGRRCCTAWRSCAFSCAGAASRLLGSRRRVRQLLDNDW